MGWRKGGTTYIQAEVAAKPEIWLAYGVTCFGVSLACVAGTLGADIYDIGRSIAACGIPATMGYLQGRVLGESLHSSEWQQFLITHGGYIAIPSAIGGSLLATGVGVWRGGSIRAFSYFGRRLWGLSYRNISPLRLIAQNLAGEETKGYVSALADAIRNVMPNAQVSVNEREITIKVVKKRTLTWGKYTYTSPETITEKLTLGDWQQKIEKLGISPDDVSASLATKMGVADTEQLPKIGEALEKFGRGSATAEDMATIMKYADEGTLKAMLKNKFSDDALRMLADSLGVSVKEGEDLAGAVAKAIKSADEKTIKTAFEKLRSMPPLKILKERWRGYARELLKQFAAGLACDLFGATSGALAASAAWTAGTRWPGAPKVYFELSSTRPTEIKSIRTGEGLQVYLGKGGG